VVKLAILARVAIFSKDLKTSLATDIMAFPHMLLLLLALWWWSWWLRSFRLSFIVYHYCTEFLYIQEATKTW